MSARTETKTVLIHAPETLRYTLRHDHPFKAIRPDATKSLLEHAGLLSPDNVVVSNAASNDDIQSIHARSYVSRVMIASRGDLVPDALEYGIGTGDTPIFQGMHEATAAIVGATLEAAELVARGDSKRALNLSGGLHHAHRDKGSGFCVYNDLSIAIKRLRSRGLRVAYIDVDAHHGDGVQWLHYDDPNVLTVSLHETGRYLFPGTGFTFELGRGEGLGSSLNVPLEPFTEDASFLEATERVLGPALAWFKPDAIVLQAGADAHHFDPLADLSLTVQGFQRLFALIVQLAEAHAGGRIIATGGGGYATWTAVPRVWASLYAALEGLTMPHTVPESWINQWQAHANDALPRTMFDDAPSIPRKPEIEYRNAKTVTQLLEDWRRVTGQ